MFSRRGMVAMDTYLLSVYDGEACFHVREGVGRSEDSFTLVLIDEFPVSATVHCERRGVHKPTCNNTTHCKVYLYRLHA